MKKYNISFSSTRFDRKPSGTEIGKISNELSSCSMDYRTIAHYVGECGCTFSPAVFDGSRKKENYCEQQLIGLDFDGGVSYNEIKNIAEYYRIPILFSYKTFSYSKDTEKFRIVFAVSDAITDVLTGETVTAMLMKIFDKCDKACADSSRMFFGGKGLIELADKESEISVRDITFAFVSYMADEYGPTHYTRAIKKFCNYHGILYKKNVPLIEDAGFVCDLTNGNCKCQEKSNSETQKTRRKVTRNFDWSVLYEKCKLYRNFTDGTEYYYYPELFCIATNLANIENGKKEFQKIINSDVNEKYESYHKRAWTTILNTIINMNYRPEGCSNCPYEKECLHAKNMILTAKPGNNTILQIVKKNYVSVSEAEKDLEYNFHKAVVSYEEGIHIIKAQTGIGKTNLYLNYMKNTNDIFLIAVPTHKLKMEVYNKAVSKGIKIAYTPELPELSSELQNMIMHSYGVGAGEYTISRLNSIFHNMKPDNPDYQILSEYFKSLNSVKNFAGHIVTTHDRLLLMRKNSPVLSGRKVIIDEDIMRTMLSTITVDNNDIFSAVNSKVFPGYAEEKLKSIIKTEGLQRHEYNSDFSIEITDDILKFLEKIDGNIIDLIDSQYTFRNEEKTIFLKRKFLPCSKVIVMSATANPEIYEMLTRYKIHFYPCKEAKYMGKAKLYTKYSFSRYALKNQKDIIKYVMDKTENDTIITVKAFEDEFKTKYHYGAVEGLNCLEGENISVVGLPNIVEEVYKLYGLAAGINSENSSMRPMRTEYKGYNFEINSFDNIKLRTIHMWMLESLIEQAVGRARLLRFDCTVKIFARFPVDQAEIG